MTTYQEAVESILVARHYRDLYLTANQGGEPPLERCSSCRHRTYIVDEAFCALCRGDSPELGCVQCGGGLDDSYDFDAELDRLYVYCRNVAEMD